MNQLKRRLAEGEVTTAFFVTMPSVTMVQLLAASGVDCLILDMEHGQIDQPTLHAMIAATRGTAATPIVRLPWMEPWLAKPVLDAGAFGLCFPMIANAAQAAATVRAVRYPPLGERGLAPSYAPARWGMAMPDYLKVADGELINMITIEQPEAVERLDEILAVPGIDAAAIATWDLTMCLGVPGQRDHPEVRRLTEIAERKILDAGIAMCGIAPDTKAAEEMVERGYRMLLLGFDVQLVQGAASQALQRVPLTTCGN